MQVLTTAPPPSPQVHWGPPCLLNCSGRGRCDWQGFCRCDEGFWGIDCALGRGRHGPRLRLETFEDTIGGARARGRGRPHTRAAEGTPKHATPRPLTPIESILANARAQSRPREGWLGRIRGGGRGGRGGGGGGGGGSGEAARSPLIYVLDMPPVLRFGVDFAPAVELKLTERLLRSSHRAATPEAADYFWMPGAPLVIEGHRLLARLWLVAERWLPDGHELLGASGGAGLGWGNGTGARWHAAGAVGGAGGAADAKPRPLVFMPLLTERASMDSFQLSYSDNDREEWPGLDTALHVRGLLAHSPACRYHHDMKIDGESHEAAATTDETAEIETLSMGHLERRLARALAARRRRVSASSLVALFGGGGYEYFEARAAGGRGCSDGDRVCRKQLARSARRDASGVGRGASSSARDYCTLPESFLAWSPKRFWAGVQFNGNTRGPVWFQRGRDVVIPQLLLLKDGGSHADQPSCERMVHTSPFSPSFGGGRARGVRRPNLLWFGGHPGHDDARTRIFRLHRQVEEP